LQDDEGQLKDAQYRVYKDDRGLVKVSALGEQPAKGKKRK
jgi:hypothetical protein